MDKIFNELINQSNELLEKAKSMDKIIDLKELDKPISKILTNIEKIKDTNSDLPNKFESNSKYEIDGKTYETDDNGNVYKIDGELLPNNAYTIRDITYTTDDKGRIISWKGKPKYDPENERDTKAQTESGGADRKHDDDGGHLVGRILGGAPDNGNVVPIRSTLNRGDYKISENEIISATKQGKDVEDCGTITYEGDSNRPSKIERTYTIDGEKTVLTIDNVEGSQDLLKDLEGNISDENLSSLKDEISDMQEDGCEVSVTSVKTKYDSEGNPVSVTVGIRNETTGEKTYKTYDAK